MWVDSSTGSSAGLPPSLPRGGWSWRPLQGSAGGRRASLLPLHTEHVVSLCGSLGLPKETENGNLQASWRQRPQAGTPPLLRLSVNEAGPEPARIPGAGKRIPPWESHRREGEVVTENLLSSLIRHNFSYKGVPFSFCAEPPPWGVQNLFSILWNKWKCLGYKKCEVSPKQCNTEGKSWSGCKWL